MPAEWRRRIPGLESLGDVLADEPMAAHTTFGVGGPAALFVRPGDARRALRLLSALAGDGIPYLVLGKGSNLLVGDGGYDGVVVAMDGLTGLSCEGTRIRAEAGVSLHAAAALALENGLSGLEFASGIPGTVGGAVFMNAGAYGREIRDVMTRALVLAEAAERGPFADCWQTPDELEMSYRFSRCERDGLVVLEAEFELTPDDPEAIRARMADLASRRREKQPLEYRSAGSTFKRPKGHFAGKLIQDAGLAGFMIGGARVSEKHCGFVINYDHASAADILALCRHIEKTVQERFGVTLEPEIRLVGKF